MIKENDFIEIDYVARIKDDGIFDLTLEDVARQNNIYDKNYRYHPIIICVGKRDIVPGVDKQLAGKELGRYSIEVKPEEGFGKKDAKLIKLIPTKEFTKQNIKPMPGMQLNLDGYMGRIISVTGGRTLVDFNSPLAGKELIYEVEIKRIATDKKEKLDGFLELLFKEFKTELKDDEAIIEIKDINEELKGEIEKEIIDRIKIKKVTFNMNNKT